MAIIAALCLVTSIPPALAQTSGGGPNCDSPQACARIVAENEIEPPAAPGVPMGIREAPFRTASQRLVAFGDAGVAALLPLLEDANPRVRERAGYILRDFPTIEARHAPTLIRAQRRGVGWVEGAIALTGSDEALDFLWADFLAKPEMSSNAQTFFGLRRFGARTYPLILAEMRRCRSSDDRTRCMGLNALIGELREPPPFALDEWEAIARSPLASKEVRGDAASELIGKQHPYGLVVLTERLQAARGLAKTYRDPSPLGGPGAGWEENFSVRATLDDISKYGAAAQSTGPLMVDFIQARGLEEARVAAARAVGQIGYRPAAPVLLAQTPDFEDNWKLAYQSAESLGRLGAGETELEALAQRHWYRPVRNNATRALNLLRTGVFGRPGVADDILPPQFISDLNYRGDSTHPPAACVSAASRPYSALGAGIDWPGEGKGVVGLQMRAPSEQAEDAFAVRYPKVEVGRGRWSFIAPVGAYHLVGTNAGEFRGGVFAIDPKGKSKLLIDDNAVAAFPWEGGALVVTGLSHMGLSRGDLWFVRLGKQGPEVTRRAQLPGAPTAFALAWPQTLVITADDEQVALTRDGHLVDAASVPGCATGQHPTSE